MNNKSTIYLCFFYFYLLLFIFARIKIITMAKQIKTNFTEAEFRQIIREEIKAALNNEDDQVAGTNQEGYITLDQAAEFLKVAKQTLYAKTSAGKIPFIKNGKRLLFRKSELTDWLNKGESK